MLKKITFFIFILVPLFSVEAFAQKKTAELGLLLGRSYYIGEINPTTHYGDGVGSFTFGGVFRYNLNKRYSLKAMLVRTTLTGSDQAAELPFNTARMATFETKLTEFSGTIEFNFFPYKIGDKKHFATPYLFVGFSIYDFDPESKIDGEEVVTEESEGGRALALPFGPGLKLNIGRKTSLAFEWGFRKTSRDDIDGLPNRQFEVFEIGKPYDNDWYVVSGFMLTFKITDEGPCPAINF